MTSLELLWDHCFRDALKVMHEISVGSGMPREFCRLFAACLLPLYNQCVIYSLTYRVANRAQWILLVKELERERLQRPINFTYSCVFRLKTNAFHFFSRPATSDILQLTAMIIFVSHNSA